MSRHNSLITVYDELGSTNDSILAAAAGAAPEWTTHVAITQSAGRGRDGRRWWSPRGSGLWMSTLIRPAAPRERWPLLALVAGFGARRALVAMGFGEVGLEWPNDLVARRRKLGGILCETRGTAASAAIAIGIGINVDLTQAEARATIPADLAVLPICLTELGPPDTTDVAILAERVLDALRPIVARFEEGARVGALAGDDLAHRGNPVQVALPDGTIFQGVVDGLGDRGELLVRAGGSTRRVIAGDVDYLEGRP
jgi:BirA family biotin operon repressor/biotin-[acetyl-CoA-carboxylase] ligase